MSCSSAHRLAQTLGWRAGDWVMFVPLDNDGRDTNACFVCRWYDRVDVLSSYLNSPLQTTMSLSFYLCSYDVAAICLLYRHLCPYCHSHLHSHYKLSYFAQRNNILDNRKQHHTLHSNVTGSVFQQMDHPISKANSIPACSILQLPATVVVAARCQIADAELVTATEYQTICCGILHVCWVTSSRMQSPYVSFNGCQLHSLSITTANLLLHSECFILMEQFPLGIDYFCCINW